MRGLICASTSSTVNVNGVCFKSLSQSVKLNLLVSDMCVCVYFEIWTESDIDMHPTADNRRRHITTQHTQYVECVQTAKSWLACKQFYHSLCFSINRFFFLCFHSLYFLSHWLLMWCCGAGTNWKLKKKIYSYISDWEKSLFKTMAWLEYFATRNSIYTYLFTYKVIDEAIVFLFYSRYTAKLWLVRFYLTFQWKPKWMLKANNSVLLPRWKWQNKK